MVAERAGEPGAKPTHLPNWQRRGSAQGRSRMKKTMLVMAMAIALAMSTMATAFAAPPDGSATGGVTFNSGAEGISFNAFDYGDEDEDDRGTATYTNYFRDFTYTAEITAVSVDAEAGTACFQYQVPADAEFSAGYVLTYKVVDSGTPSSSPDGVYYSVDRSGDAPDLEAACASVRTRPTTSGNLVVRSVR